MNAERPYETLDFEIRDRIAYATFATPERLNSITEARLQDLERVVARVRDDGEVHALVLGGRGRAFCVGLDLGLLQRAFDDLAYFEAIVRRLNGVLLEFEALPVPVIAAVNGYARAGGFEIALACDLLLIADEARIGDNHTHVGVMPGGGSTQRLPRRIGEQRAMELIWSARWLTGPEAAAIGLALRSVPAAELDAAVESLVAPMRSQPRACLGAVKGAIHAGRTLPVPEGVEFEIRAFVDYMGGQPYAREGFVASREGRPPNWQMSRA
jgi:enoyl-CoA hydratase/carnithine racemase